MNNKTEAIDKSSAVPVYYQVAKIYENKIRLGELKPGESLPPEHKIATQYQISRMTVRQAIGELNTAGLVYTEKGKGTFVAQPELDSLVFELDSFYEQLEESGKTPRARLLEAKIIKADALLCGKLKVAPGTRCLFFRFVVTAGGEPLVYETKCVVYTKQKPILEKELNDPSLSKLALAHSVELPMASKRVLQAAIVTEEEASVLGVDKNTPVLFVEQTIYDLNKNPMGWGKSIYRGDRCKLVKYDGWNKKDL